MTAKLQNFVRGSKDAALAVAIETFFNSKYSRIGRMTDVSVDTANRELRVRLELTGESTPVEVHVKKYSVEQRTEGARLTIVEATASREWLTQVLQQFVVGRTFAIPPRAAAVLKLLT